MINDKYRMMSVDKHLFCDDTNTLVKWTTAGIMISCWHQFTNATSVDTISLSTLTSSCDNRVLTKKDTQFGKQL